MLARIFVTLLVILDYCYLEDNLNAKESSQVEVRAVFIDCQINEKLLQSGSETSRFQREELFKHNALRDCKKKLALTVKMTSDSGYSSSDEYIPIEHVFDGSNKRRVRLLNPYIIRIRREPPFEMYKLNELDIFCGILTTSKEKTYRTHGKATKNPVRRKILFTNKDDWSVPKIEKDKTNSYIQRNKRFDFNIGVQHNPLEEITQTRAPYRTDNDAFSNNNNILSFNYNINVGSKNVTEDIQAKNMVDGLEGTEKKFHLYEVGNPDILFRAQVQLLEKLSTPEGKTVWKDLTKQGSARISSLYPEWTNKHVNIRYRSAEWIPKEDFTLPSTGICLLLPQNGKLNDGFSNDKIEDFIIVPLEDIEAIDESSAAKRSHGNSSMNSVSASETGQSHRRILVRLARALFGRNENNFIIVNDNSGKYLRIPYRQPHHAHIKVEAKADENQLVYIGSSGRLTMAVSESTRRSRAVLTVQATNTGLAAARLRPMVRECTPELLRFNEDVMGVQVKAILIPPMHTHKFCLEIPLEMTGDIAHCTVTLLNEGDESIAIRDVRIKRGDRCFCVWHCQCVCLNEDPKLLCQEMAEYQQVAAGLALRDRPRQVRAACYPDVASINLIVIVFGVLLFLLLLGLLKACVGLFIQCAGSWGIDQLLQTPRRLDRYYERSLRCRTVVFDEDGWPVHPDTMKRTVRLISKPMEFILNVIFFVTMPCLLIWNSVKQVMSSCRNKKAKGDCDLKTKNCCRPQEMQGKDDNKIRSRRRYRRRHLSKWMTPQAEQLLTDIWRNGLAPQGFTQPECMRPLLREDRFKGNKLYKLHSPVVDSEQDDTEYVLMQMQNSRESLSKPLQRNKPSLIMD